MKHGFLGALMALLVAVCSGAAAGFGTPAAPQEIARESLDLLKTMARRSTTAHTYVGTCVTAIAHAKRYEDRSDVVTAKLESIWAEAAGRCRGLASRVCATPALEAPRDACNRIRAFDPVLQ
ncbi:MAG TPA: hypothetical protein VFM98_15685 [Ramlibacter sp.]|uniref:hypothetical protein n=1 Tax=Ramlibacter sp. TaxID=1917967 RepID=UPI002D7E33AF|nr:hypothetical protein [Ramlibacter sp.]HET8747041.1 hypothetical protein [Ramlibacter sp.]